MAGRAAACLIVLLVLLLSGCVSPIGRPRGEAAPFAEIRWTTHGIPHIVASDWRGLGHGYGYAAARDYLCDLAEEFVTVWGLRSYAFGPDGRPQAGYQGAFPLSNLDSDTFFRVYWANPKLWRPATSNMPESARQAFAGFATGYNQYLSETPPEARGPCGSQWWVRPITFFDVELRILKLQLFASGYQFASAMAAAAPPTLPAPSPAPQGLPGPRESGPGSNAYAFGRDTTAHGAGLLLVNPHFPWYGPERFHQVHFTIPGKVDILGATLLGVPVIPIGVTGEFAWTHTVSYAWRFTLHELTLDPSNPLAYVYDGQIRRITPYTVAIVAREASGQLKAINRTVYFSHFGPMVVLDLADAVPGVQGLDWTRAKAYTIRDANAHNDRLLQQYYAFNEAPTFDAFRDRLRSILGVPWVHTTAVSRDGRAYYGDVSVVPNVSHAQILECNTPAGRAVAAATSPFPLYILDGSRSSCNWNEDAAAPQPGILPAKQLPEWETTSYALNANANHWLPNPRHRLEGFGPLLGDERSDRGGRTRMSYQLIEERLAGTARCDIDPGVDCRRMTPGRLQDLLLNWTLLWADLVLPDLLPQLCLVPHGVTRDGRAVDLGPACQVLRAWDRTARLDSRGMPLFRLFWESLGPSERAWRTPFSPDDPVRTPRDLVVDNPLLRERLAEAVVRLTDANVPLGAPLRDVQFVERGGERIPLPGAPGSLGTPNFLEFPFVPRQGFVEVDTRTSRALHGHSIVLTATWDAEGPVIEGFLTYGQSTNPASPHYADQTRDYSMSAWNRIPFLDRDILADPNLEVRTFPFRVSGRVAG